MNNTLAPSKAKLQRTALTVSSALLNMLSFVHAASLLKGELKVSKGKLAEGEGELAMSE